MSDKPGSEARPLRVAIIGSGREEFFLGGTMGWMAGITLTVDDGFVGVCLQKLDFSVDVTGVTNRIRLGF